MGGPAKINQGLERSWPRKTISELHPTVRRRLITITGNFIGKIPKITRFENCVMEIDTARGVISIAHGGRIKFQVSRIPLGRLALPTITVVAAAEIK
jgi:hypothetical protein